MQTPRISASSYSNTAPLIWSFLYGSQHGSVELILDNAPARSAELLKQSRVDAALVPVIAYHDIDHARLIRGVCVGATERVRSVCLVTRGKDLANVRSVALDVSSRTSVVLTKIIFREFLGFDPEWRVAEPNVDSMLDAADCALLIGDPALRIADSSNAECGTRNAESVIETSTDFDAKISSGASGENSAFRVPRSALRKFDLAQLWKTHTGLGFVFAMWMTRSANVAIDFAAARNEGVAHISDIVSNYIDKIGLSADEMTNYLSENISYEVDDSMQSGMELYFRLAGKCGLIERERPLSYLE